MPLITCPDCHKPVSDCSDKCIHCGCPLHLNTGLKNDSSTEEIIYYRKDGVHISNTNIMFNKRTFNPKLVTSVSVSQIPNLKKAWLRVAYFFGLIFSVFLVMQIVVLFAMISFSDKNSSYYFLFSILLVGITAIICWATYLARKRYKLLDAYGRIDLDTSSGRIINVLTIDYNSAHKIGIAISKLISDKKC